MEADDHSSFFQSTYGLYNWKWRGKRLGPVKDFLFDARLWLNRSYLALQEKAEKQEKRNILVVGVEVPARAQDLQKVMKELAHTRHNVTAITATLAKGKGKFQNINDALKALDVNAYDWLIVVDDDIAMPAQFLDKFIYLAESADLQICQPAHRFRSYQSFEMTLRCWDSLVRLTHFVECGPLTAIRKPVFPHVLPFPELRWAWGTDIDWAEIARKENFRIGIIDATPIRHLRPVGASYDWKKAEDEAAGFLNSRGITRRREDILQTIKVISHI